MLERYGVIGCEQFFVLSYDQEVFASESGAREAGIELAAVADALANGAGLHYHNHTFEFTSLEKETAFDVFAAATGGVRLDVVIL